MNGREFAALESLARRRTPRGFALMGIFLLFGAGMAAVAGFTLIWPSPTGERIWRLNSLAYQQLSPFGRPMGILFLMLSAILIFTAIGWFERRLWGWALSVIIIVTQILGDVVNAILGHWVRGLAGVLIAGVLLYYLLRAPVRSTFSSSNFLRR